MKVVESAASTMPDDQHGGWAAVRTALADMADAVKVLTDYDEGGDGDDDGDLFARLPMPDTPPASPGRACVVGYDGEEREASHRARAARDAHGGSDECSGSSARTRAQTNAFRGEKHRGRVMILPRSATAFPATLLWAGKTPSNRNPPLLNLRPSQNPRPSR